MTIRRTGKALAALLLAVLFLAAHTCPAFAADPEMRERIPGTWIFSLYADEPTESWEEPPTVDLAFLTLEEDGKMTLACRGRDGQSAYSFEGAWSFEYSPESYDSLTLLFASAAGLPSDGAGYSRECVYDAYTESWVEDGVLIRYLILTEIRCSGVSPFEEVYGEDGAWSVALYRELRPNMRVVNCKEYVSLRQKPSKSSARLMKVPLGAFVLAFPEHGEKNGFTWCLYSDEYGYILTEYLEPVDPLNSGQ